MATYLKRTESIITPALFKFDEHFELQAIIGSSRSSEVGSHFSKQKPLLQKLPCKYVLKKGALIHVTFCTIKGAADGVCTAYHTMQHFSYILTHTRVWSE